jgi:HK97 family phage portal protein
MPKETINIYSPLGGMKSVSIPGWAEAFNAGTIIGSQATNASDAYLASAWAFRAVGLRADAIATAPLMMYDRNDEPMDHLMMTALRNVNADWNYSDLWRYTESDTLIFGSAFWLKVRARNGNLLQIIRLNPASMKVEISEEDVTEKGVYIPAGTVTGFTQTLKGKRRIYDRGEVIYFRGAYNPDSDHLGVASLITARLAALGEQNADRYMDAFFRNGAVPALILASDQALTDQQIEKVSTWWSRLFRGVTKQHKVGIMGNGLKPVQVGNSNKDLALAEIRQEMHRSISTALGVPELLISPTNAADLTPVAMALKIFYSTTVSPRWHWYEEVLNSDLLGDYPDLKNQGVYLKFDTSEIGALQEDIDNKAVRLTALVGAGIIKAEVAALELGYELEDVPEEAEPEQEPAQPVPLMVQQPQEDQEETEPGEDVEEVQKSVKFIPSVDQLHEMELWRRFAFRKLKRSEPLDFAFEVKTLPEYLANVIRENLSVSSTEDDIKKAFDVAGVEIKSVQSVQTEPGRYDDLITELKATRAAMYDDPVGDRMSPVTVNLPTINLPNVELTTPPAVVTVNVPEQPAPVINVSPADVIVNVSPTPITNQVDVNIPEKGKIKLLVKRDHQGRIIEIGEV